MGMERGAGLWVHRRQGVSWCSGAYRGGNAGKSAGTYIQLGVHGLGGYRLI